MKAKDNIVNWPVAASFVVTAVVLVMTEAMAQGLPADLNGLWTSSQYQCPLGQYTTKTVQIVQVGQQIEAVMKTGDTCGAAGFVNFKGTLFGGTGQLTCYQTNPGGAGSVRVIDANNIEACNLLFVRVGGAASVGAANSQAGTYSGGQSAGAPLPSLSAPVTPTWPGSVTPTPPYYGGQQPPVTPVPSAPSAQLQAPIVTPDDSNQRFSLRVNGQLVGANGAAAWLSFYFEYFNTYEQTWKVVKPVLGETQYADSTGNVASAINFSVMFDPYELGVHSLEIPYAKLNMAGPVWAWLPPIKHQLRTWAEVHVNGVSVGRSVAVNFDYSQGYKN